MKTVATTASVVVIVSIFASAVHSEPTAFTNYGAEYRAHPQGLVWGGFYLPGPFAWYSGPDDLPAPFWNATMSFVETDIPDPSSYLDFDTLTFHGFLNSYLTIEAHEGDFDGPVIGTMALNPTGPGHFIVELDASGAIVDAETGSWLVRAGAPPDLPGDQPIFTYTPGEETGVFADDGITLVGEQQVYFKGLFGGPLSGGDLQGDIFAGATAGLGHWVWTGHYVPEPSTLVSLLSFGAAGLLVCALRRRRRVT